MNARVIAFYLPQYYPIPENEKWWGEGFTEWTNVRKAKPLFKGHDQPRYPADLGYYDQRDPEVRQAQAVLAAKHGIEGFCYWHYCFGNGRRILERPFTEVLQSGKPEFPFCPAWANHSWYEKLYTFRSKNKLLIEQTYPGTEDFIDRFRCVLPAFKDKRYISVDGKPIFVIFSISNSDKIRAFIHVWRRLAVDNGLTGIFIVG